MSDDYDDNDSYNDDRPSDNPPKKALVAAGNEVHSYHRTAAEAKADAINHLTMDVYQRASQLRITQSEQQKLEADFPDDALRPGAAGKDNLIYIEHAHLRRRLNEVFGPGQWTIIPRSRWTEKFTTRKGEEAVKVYVEAMLCIRGCYVDEAIGDMDYFPSNGTMNFGDAVEGAKTQALRRCCKTLGIGLQAWDKNWCDKWWEARRNGTRTTPEPKKPDPPNAEVVTAWQAKIDGVDMNTFNVNGLNGWLPEVKAIADAPTRLAVWKLVMAFATENNCMFDDGAKQFVAKETSEVF